jgi:hypothetical protein
MKTIFLFLAGFGLQEILGLFFFFVVIALLFIAIRSLVLWYYKIDTILQNQEKQIALLSELLSEARKAKV